MRLLSFPNQRKPRESVQSFAEGVAWNLLNWRREDRHSSDLTTIIGLLLSTVANCANHQYCHFRPIVHLNIQWFPVHLDCHPTINPYKIQQCNEGPLSLFPSLSQHCQGFIFRINRERSRCEDPNISLSSFSSPTHLIFHREHCKESIKSENYGGEEKGVGWGIRSTIFPQFHVETLIYH